MNADKLKKLTEEVRIGGKGSVRRKKKIVHRTTAVDDKKIQSTLKKVNCNAIPGIDEVNMFKSDGTVLHFNNPKVQLALASNMVSVTGTCEPRKLVDMMPRVMNQLGKEQVVQYCKAAGVRRMGGDAHEDGEDASGEGKGSKKGAEEGGAAGAGAAGGGDDDDDDEIPALVEDFEAATLGENRIAA